MVQETKPQSQPSEFARHTKSAGKAFIKQWKSLIPAEFWNQGRVAQREMLLAMRSLVDRAIEHVEQVEEKPSAANARSKTRGETG